MLERFLVAASVLVRGLIIAALSAFICGSLSSVALAAPQGPAAKSNEVLRAVLSNGLRVVIVRNRLAPVVATAVNYLVGSDEAPAGFPGTAHAQEHMMFRGAPGLTVGQLADIGDVMGGNFNANTRESLTQYLYTVPAEDIDIALHIEALRMRAVDDSQEAWDRERGAIEQEVAQDLSNPFYQLYSKIRARLFAGSIYELDALGSKPSFDSTTAASLKAFHDTWYAPNNAILIVVGDVEPAATLAKIHALFDGIPAKRLPPKPVLKLGPVESSQITIPTDQSRATELLAMRLPGLDSPDFPALEVLSDVLGSHRFDLYGLVAQGKAASAQFSLDPLPQGGVGLAAVSFRADGDPAQMETAIRNILNNVRNNGVPAQLVEAAKIQERRQTEFLKNSIAGLASVWSDALALYGLPSPDADLVRIDKVTVAEVNRVAREYLDLDHAISATLLPQSSGGPVTSTASYGGQETIALGQANGEALPDWASALMQNLQPPPATLHPNVTKLSNGLTLIVLPATVSDTVSIYGHIRNRPEVEEPAGKEGVSLLVDQLFPFGTESHDRLGFQEAIDAIGADENAGTNFRIEVLRPDFETGAALLAENELHPAFPVGAFQSVKAQLVAYIERRNSSPAYLAQQGVRVALYPTGDPILRQADTRSMGSLSRDDVLSYYKFAYRPDLATIVVVGNITAGQAKAVISRYFGAWRANGLAPQVDMAIGPPNHSTSLAVPDTSRIQDVVTLAQTLALPRASPDYYALALGNAVLGGGFYATRLSIDLRENAGLVYSVNSDIQANRTRSAFMVRYASDPQSVTEAAAAVGREVANMRSQPVPSEELLKAKAFLLRQIPLRESSVNDIAREFLDNQDLGLPVDESAVAARSYIQLDSAAVQAAFSKWMRPEDFVRISQGPAP